MQINKESRVSEQHTYSLSIRRIRPEEQTLMQTAKADNPGTSDWPWCSVPDWKENNRPVERPGGYLNSASMGVLSRRIMATEWARALGRGSPIYHAFTSRRSMRPSGRRVQR